MIGVFGLFAGFIFTWLAWRRGFGVVIRIVRWEVQARRRIMVAQDEGDFVGDKT